MKIRLLIQGHIVMCKNLDLQRSRLVSGYIRPYRFRKLAWLSQWSSASNRSGSRTFQKLLRAQDQMQMNNFLSVYRMLCWRLQRRVSVTRRQFRPSELGRKMSWVCLALQFSTAVLSKESTSRVFLGSTALAL